MAKRKRLTLTESHLEELFLKYVEVLKYKPDYWERVGYKHRLDTWKRLRLGLLAEQSLLEKDPIGFLKSALNYDSYELFKYLLPRDMEPETRFGPKQVETWKSGYKIYGLHRKEGLNFRQIAKLLGKSRSTVHRLYKKVHKHIELTEHDRDTIRRQEEKIHPPTVLCLGKEGRQTDRCPYRNLVDGIPQCEKWGLCPEGKKFVEQGRGPRINYPGAPTVHKAEKELAKQCDTGRRTPRLREEEPDEERPFQSVLVVQLDRSQAGTAFEKLIRRTCIKQFPKAEGYEQCGYKPGSPKCSGCNCLFIDHRASEMPKWTIDPGLWGKIQLQLDGIRWNSYVESFTKAPIRSVPKENIPGERYISYRYQRIDEQVIFEWEKNLLRKKELEWQREYIEKNGVEPWVKKFRWDGKKTIKPKGEKTIYHPTKAPVVPCADCKAECFDGNTFPCEKLKKWTEGRYFATGEKKKYETKVHCISCGSSNTESLVSHHDRKREPWKHSDVWACKCGVWFSPVERRYAEMICQYQKEMVTRNIEDYLISLLDEGREYGISDLFEIVLAAPIEKVDLGLKEETTPPLIKKWKPLLPPWPSLYDDVYDGYADHWTMWRDKYRAYKCHLIEGTNKEKRKYHPVVTTQNELPITMRLRGERIFCCLCFKKFLENRKFRP